MFQLFFADTICDHLYSLVCFVSMGFWFCMFLYVSVTFHAGLTPDKLPQQTLAEKVWQTFDDHMTRGDFLLAGAPETPALSLQTPPRRGRAKSTN